MAKSVVQIIISGEAKGALEAFKEVEHGAEGFGGKMKTAGLVAGAALGGAVVGVGAFAVDAVRAAMKGEQAHAQLSQAITNTGRSYDQFGPRIEGATQKLAGFGYENDQVEGALTTLIQGSGNVSKSLDNIGLAANIAKGRHMDLNSAALLVGKVMAGNTTVLKRMGITYPGVAGGAQAFQKAQVGVLQAQIALNKTQDAVNSGHLKGKAATDALALAHGKLNAAIKKANDTEHAGASAIKFLSDRFRGDAQASAQTLQGRIDSLKAHFENWKEEIGNKLLPVVSKLADWLSAKLPGAIATATAWVKRIGHDISEAVGFFVSGFQGAEDKGNGFLDTLQRWGADLRTFVDWVKAKWPAVREAIVGAFEAISAWVQSHWPIVKAALIGAAVAIAAAFVAWAASAAAAALATAAAAAPFIAVGVAIAAVVGALVYAYQHWALFRTVVQATCKAIVVAALGVVRWFQTNWPTIARVTVEVWNRVYAAVRSAITQVVAVVRVTVGIIKTIWSTFHSQIIAIAKVFWGQIRGTIQSVMLVIRGVIKTITSLIRGDWSGAWAGIRQVLAGVWLAMLTTVKTYLGYIKAAISAAWTGVKQLTASLWGQIKGAVSTGVSNVIDVVKSLPGRALSALSGAPSLLVHIGSEMVGGIARGIRNAAGAVASAIHSIGFHYGGSHITVLGKTVTLVPAFSFHLAKGTAGLPFGGLAMVGEEGPEAVWLPRGTRVSSAAATRRMMEGGNGVTMNIYVAGSIVTERQLIDTVQRGLIAKQQTIRDLGLNGPKWRLAS